jgi:lysophospholipase L1-like esterase
MLAMTPIPHRLFWAALSATFAACPAFAAAPVLPITIHLAGDSTMAEKLPEKRPETGWAEHLAAQFRAGTVTVDNRAKNGRSTRTFIGEGRWQALLDATRPGDVVLIQFGHNDASENKPDRYTPPADYTRNLTRFVADVRERKAVPVLLTPVARRRFDEAGRLQSSHGVYPDLVRELATRDHVALVDMERRSSALLQETGDEASKTLFLWVAPGTNPNYPGGVEDNTHFSPEGAQRVAREFVLALCGLDVPVKELLRRPCE